MSEIPQPCSICIADSQAVGCRTVASTLVAGPDPIVRQCPDAVDDEIQKLIGRTLEGRYEVLRNIGGGGMGLVFEARHRFTGRPVAIKLLRPSFGQSLCMRDAFYREAQLLGRVDHPNVYVAYDLGHSDEGIPFLVLPLLKGQNLLECLDGSPEWFTWPRIEDIFTQILNGVIAMHDAGIAHCDLKPANLWLSLLTNGREHVTIIDFGIASPVALRRSHPNGCGVVEFIAGTPRYMAPERARGGERIDRRLDVYSLGVVLLDLLTGDVSRDLRPRRAVGGTRTLAPQWSELFPSACAPPQLAGILARALAWSPAARYPSARVLRHAFLQVAHNTDPTQIEPARIDAGEAHRKAG